MKPKPKINFERNLALLRKDFEADIKGLIDGTGEGILAPFMVGFIADTPRIRRLERYLKKLKKAEQYEAP